jgi:hypothetical protein
MRRETSSSAGLIEDHRASSCGLCGSLVSWPRPNGQVPLRAQQGAHAGPRQSCARDGLEQPRSNALGMNAPR